MANDGLTETPPKRRRFQFSLKLLLVLIGIMAVVFASIGRPYNQLLKERKVAARLNELKGTVTWEGYAQWGDEIVWPYISEINLGHTKVTDTDLAGVGTITNLKELILDHTQVSAAGLSYLTNLNQLHYLYLVGTPTTDEGLKSVAAMSNLESLFLFDSQFTDEGMNLIAALPKLSSLMIDNTAATDSGVGYLKSLPNLEVLTIVGQPTVSDGVLLELRDQVTVQWFLPNGGALQVIRQKFPLRQKTTGE